MPWTVDNIYQGTKMLCNKNGVGSISATDLFYAWNQEQAKYHQDIVGKWQRQSNTKTGVATGLIEDEITISKLSPFIIPAWNNPVVGGQGLKPPDYIYGIALRINGTKVFNISHDMIWAVNDDVIDPPSISNNAYYYAEYTTPNADPPINYFYFLPNSVTSFDLDYVAETTDIVWGYTIDPVTGMQVYSAANSKQPKWNKNTVIEITDRTLKRWGIHFSSQDFEMFGQSNIVTGD